MTTQRYIEPCPHCTFVTTYGPYDLLYCADGGRTPDWTLLILRHGNGPLDYVAEPWAWHYHPQEAVAHNTKDNEQKAAYALLSHLMKENPPCETNET